VLKRRVLWLAAAALIGFGAWNLGHAAYIHVKAQLAQHLLQTAWAETQAGTTQAKPWPWADTYPVARLTMPQRGVDLIVLAGASGRTLAFGPGHLDGTPLPGEAGNSVLSAHRDTHFAFLRDARPGDVFFVEGASGRKTRFAVHEAHVVDERDLSVLRSTESAQLTLVTCYPFDAIQPGGPLRYVVIAWPAADSAS
jgi:sortase A